MFRISIANIALQTASRRNYYDVCSPDGRFGALEMASDGVRVSKFLEKPKGDGSWINGGFFVCEPRVFNYLTDGDYTVLEREPLQNLAQDGELYTYQHSGFWKCMDTLKDKTDLNEMVESGAAPWIIWD